MNILFLFHYYNRDFKPFKSLTELPFEEAKQILLQQKADGKFRHPNIDVFLQKRYDRDRKLRKMFLARGGNPQRTVPIYMMLGEHKQWASAYENPAVIKIRLSFPKRLNETWAVPRLFTVTNTEKLHRSIWIKIMTFWRS